MENKKLEILVVEDNLDFLEIAKRVATSRTNLIPNFFQSYEPAIDYLKNNSADGVITDLFFPSLTDFRQVGLEQVYKMLAKISDSETPEAPGEKLIEVMKSFSELQENPAGIGMAKYCFDNKIPYIIVSQGDRHKGDLWTTREMSWYFPTGFLGKNTYSGGPVEIPDLMLYQGSHIDKSKEKTWIDAFEKVEKSANAV
jgi:hypothetical protein